jgi:hypothetical protein
MGASSSSSRRKAALRLSGAFFFLLAIQANAQAVRVAATPSPLNSAGSLSVSATPGLVYFNLVSGGVSSGSSAVAITTSWDKNSCSTGCTVTLYAYFASSGSALSGGSPAVRIPSSAVLGQVPGGTPASFTPFTQSSPIGGGGASLQLYQQSYIKHQDNSRTDNLNLQIDLSSQPQLPAGTYTGTLYIQAQSL